LPGLKADRVPNEHVSDSIDSRVLHKCLLLRNGGMKLGIGNSFTTVSCSQTTHKRICVSRTLLPSHIMRCFTTCVSPPSPAWFRPPERNGKGDDTPFPLAIYVTAETVNRTFGRVSVEAPRYSVSMPSVSGPSPSIGPPNANSALNTSVLPSLRLNTYAPSTDNPATWAPPPIEMTES